MTGGGEGSPSRLPGWQQPVPVQGQDQLRQVVEIPQVQPTHLGCPPQSLMKGVGVNTQSSRRLGDATTIPNVSTKGGEQAGPSPPIVGAKPPQHPLHHRPDPFRRQSLCQGPKETQVLE